MSWILSITSLIMLWLMGNRSKWGPIVGILNQFLWLWYAISIKEWGLILGVLAYFIVHVRNLLKWSNP